MTLIHEIHLVAFEKYGRNIKPHGQEWKHTFQQLMVPYIDQKIIPTFITLCKTF
jgi:predicted SprT family Zn-dependent metalloprotease